MSGAVLTPDQQLIVALRVRVAERLDWHRQVIRTLEVAPERTTALEVSAVATELWRAKLCIAELEAIERLLDEHAMMRGDPTAEQKPLGILKARG